MVKKFLFVVVLLFVIFFSYGSAINSAFAYDYTRTPSDYTIETSGSSEFIDFYFYELPESLFWYVFEDPSSEGVNKWTIGLFDEDGVVVAVGDCMDYPLTVAYDAPVDVPVGEIWQVSILGYIDSCNTDPNAYIAFGSEPLEIDEVNYDTIFEVVNGDPDYQPSLEYFWSPVFDNATTTCTPDGSSTVCVSTQELQISYHDWLLVNLFIIFLLTLSTVGIFFSISLRNNKKSL